MNFTTFFTNQVQARNAKLSTPFSAQQLELLLAVWQHHNCVVEDFDPEIASEDIAKAVGEDRCEDGCIILEWA